ncbi:MAG: Ig-like domain-containing protein [Myxococcota bacterium]
MISAATLLANDSDVEGETLTITAVNQANNGTVTLSQDGTTITFTPAADIAGTAAFEYTVSDGNGGTDTAAVVITLAGVNDAPVANDDTVGAVEDELKIILVTDLLGNDTDADGDTLVIDSVVNATNSTATLEQDGSISFTPNADFTGDATFEYVVSDGNGGTDTGFVTVTVGPAGDAPVATDDSAATAEDTPLTLSSADLTANDTDADAEQLTVTAVGNATDGSVVLNVDGSITFTPNADFNGTATFEYTVSDPTGGTDEGLVSVTVGAANDGPVAGDDVATVDEDNTLTINAADLLANDTDIDADTLSLTALGTATDATATLDNGAITVTFAQDFNGTATFEYTVSDGNLTDTGLVTITVNAVNDAPVANADSLSVSEDGTLVVLSADVLGNDTDVDQDTLTISSVQSGAGGAAALELDGSITFVADPNFVGDATFEYTISDGNLSASATVTVAVGAVDDLPVATDDTKADGQEDVAVVFQAADLTGNDVEVDGDTLAITLVENATHGSVELAADGTTVTFTPELNYNGDATFEYTISDGTSTDVGLVTITLAAVNDAPVATDDSAANITALVTDEDTNLIVVGADLLLNDINVDTDALTVTAVTSVGGGTATLEIDGTITFVPTPDFNGDATFEYTVTDTENTSDVGLVTVTVNSVNDAPVVTDDSGTTDEDVPLVLSVAVLLSNDTDVDGDTLSLTVDSVSAGSFTLDGDTLTYTPAQDSHDPATITVTVSDGNGGSVTSTISVAINSVNDNPVAMVDAAVTNEDIDVFLQPAVLLANDSDVDGDTLTLTAVGNAVHGTVGFSANGRVQFDPEASYNGPASFEYTVEDGAGGTATGVVNITINPINDQPVANDDVATTAEDVPLNLSAATLLANDTDADGNPLVIATIVSNTNCTAVLEADGSVTVTPAANFFGTARFEYAVSDGIINSNPALVTVTVTSVNDAPVANDDALSANEDDILTISSASLTANDSDIDTDPLLVSAVEALTHGTVTVDGAGTVTFDPEDNYAGDATFRYTVSDGNGGTAQATVTITLAPVNDAPVAMDDTGLSTDEDTTLDVATATVLANDVNVDPDTLTVVSVADPTDSSATVTLDATGIHFSPAADFNGSSTFQYTVEDSAGSQSTARVTVTVNAVNDAPVAMGDTTSTNEDTSVTILAADVLGNDTDVDLDTLHISSVVLVTGGTAVLNADESITFNPAPNSVSDGVITYQITDGNLTATADIVVTVVPQNDTPQPQDDAKTTDEDVALTFPANDLLVNDNDIDQGDSLQVIAVQNAGGGNGAAVLNGDGTITFTPNANFFGAGRFQYTVRDTAGATAVAFVDVTINSVNDVPVANDDNFTATEDQPLVIAAATLAGNDTDVENQALTVTAVSSPAQDTGGQPAGTVTLNAGLVTYTPAPNFNGDVIFTYTVRDSVGGTATGTVNVRVNGVNDVPVAAADSLSTNEDTPLTVASTVLSGNDTDADGDTLTVTNVFGASNGSVALAGGDVTFTPNANFNGTASFSYTVADGRGGTANGTVTVAVASQNDAPVATDETRSTSEDVALNLAEANLLANDTDLDGNPLSITSVAMVDPLDGTVTVGSGLVTFTPAANLNGVGAAQFTYVVSDGQGGTDVGTVTVDITPVNDPPVAGTDSFTGLEDTPLNIPVANVLSNDSDVDVGTTLQVTAVSNPVNGSVSLSGGVITFTPNTNYNGPASFRYSLTDGVATVQGDVNLNISFSNSPPVAQNDTVSTNEDVTLTQSTDVLKANDSDSDNNPLTVVAVSNPVNGTVSLAGGSFSFTPSANFFGVAGFDYDLTDGIATVTAHVTVNVTAVNDAPVAVDDSKSTNEDVALTFPATDLSANDTDVDGDPRTVTAVSNPVNGTVSLVAGSITFTPNTNFNGTGSFEYTVSDGQGGTDTGLVTVTVNAVNDAPVAQNDTATTAEETAVEVFVLSNDSDVDTGTTLSVTGTTAPSSGTATFTATSVTYTPAANFVGTVTFSYTITDNHPTNPLTATAQVQVTVTDVNDAPVAANDTFTVAEDETTPANLVVNVLGNDTDADMGPPVNDTLKVVRIVQNGTKGTAAVDGAGVVTYTPSANRNGADTFTYEVKDRNGTGLASSATVTVTITAVNDLVVAVDDSASTSEDTPRTFTIANLVSNDTDADLADTPPQTLTIDSVNTPVNGTVSFDGTSVTFTPASNFNGSASFQYVVSDGNGSTDTGLVSVNVTPVNDAPVAVNLTASGAEGSTLTVDPRGDDASNDRDVDHLFNQLTVVLVSPPAGASVNGSNQIVFTHPNANFNGDVTVSYRLRDPASADSNVATVTFTFTAVNDTPVAVNDTATMNEDGALVIATAVLANDTDADTVYGDTITLNNATALTNGTIFNNAGTLEFRPNANFFGTATFEYTARDSAGAISAPATVTVTVNPVNDAPVAVDDSGTTDEDTQVIIAVSALVSNDTDVDGDTLGVPTVSNPSNGLVSLSSSAATCNPTPAPCVIFQPAPNYSGPAGFDYVVADGRGGTDTGRVSIAVNPVNDTPVANDDGVAPDIITTNEDTPIMLPLAQLVSNDTDADGDSLTVQNVLNDINGHGTVARVNSDGTPNATNGTHVRFTPDSNYDGPALFGYLISDRPTGGLTDQATVFVTVVAVADAPTLTVADASTNEDTPVALNVSMALNDPDGSETLSAVISGIPAGASIAGCSTAGQPAGSCRVDNVVTPALTLTPAPHSDADFALTVTATATEAANGNTANTPRTINVTVTAVADAPTLTVSAASGDEDTDISLDGKIVTALVDMDGSETLDIYISGVPEGASLSAGTDLGFGTYRLTPAQLVGLTYRHQLNAPNPVDDLPVDVTLTVEARATDTGAVTASTLSEPPTGGLDINVLPVNDIPTVTGQTVAVQEDGSILITLDASDVETDVATLSYVIDTAPTSGTLNPPGTGVADRTYTPNANFAGSDSLVFHVVDEAGASSDTAVVTIIVRPTNDAPVANLDTIDVVEDTPRTLADNVFLANDTVAAVPVPADEAGQSLMVLSAGAIPTVTLGSVADGASDITYTPPDPDYTGTDSFAYTAQDNGVTADGTPPDPDNDFRTASGTINVVVRPKNDPPVPSDDVGGAALTTSEEVAKTIPFSVLLANDTVGPANEGSGGEGQTLNITNVSATLRAGPPTPAHPDCAADLASPRCTRNFGSTVVISGSNIIYTPGTNMFGTDSFTYTVCDNGQTWNLGTSSLQADPLCRTATATVTITPVNDPPLAYDDNGAVDPAFVTDEDTPVTVFSVVNDAANNVDDEALTILFLGIVDHGTITQDAMDPNKVVWEPQPDAFNYYGLVTWQYVLQEPSGATDTGAVTLVVNSVNDLPNADNDPATTPEDNSILIDVLANDEDPVEGSALTVVSVTDPDGAGAATTSIESNQVRLTPAPNFIGVYTFSYTMEDADGGSDSATVTVTVTSVNDNPTAFADNLGSIAEDTFITADVVTNDTDVDLANSAPDTDVLTVIGVSNAVGGTPTIQGDNRSITFTAASNFNGIAGYDYTIRDLAGVQSTAHVTIVVTGVQDPVVAVNDGPVNTPEENAITIPVLDNDQDPDLGFGNELGENLRVTAVTQPPPAAGSVTITADEKQVVFTPATNFSGTGVTFTYTVTDIANNSSTATVTVNVTNNNDGPTAVDDATTVAEDSLVFSLNLITNDTDPDLVYGDDLVISALDLTGLSGATVTQSGAETVDITVNANFVGEVTFGYTVEDIIGLTDTGVVTVTVTQVPDDPVAVADGAGGTIHVNEDELVVVDALLNDTDADFAQGDVLSILGFWGVSNATVTTVASGTPGCASLNGCLQVDSDANFAGTITFNYDIIDTIDGIGTAGSTVTVVVDEVNDTPVAQDDATSTNEDTPVTFNVTANDSDVDVLYGDSIRVVAVSASNGSATFTDSDITFTPTLNFNGPTTVGYTIEDERGAQATATLNIFVVPVNDAPVANNDTFNMTEDVQGNGPAALAEVVIDPRGNDSDVDNAVSGAAIVLDTEPNPAHGIVTTTPGGLLFWPAPNFQGSTSFTYHVNDGALDSSVATITVVVANTPDAPVAVDDRFTTPMNTSRTITFAEMLANDSDPDGTSPTIFNFGARVNCTINISAGQIIVNPTTNFVGYATVEYTITDGTYYDQGLIRVAVGSPFPGDGTVDAGEPCDDDNYLANDGCTCVLGGSCTLDAAPAETCADIRAANASAADGTYRLHPQHDPDISYLAYCHNMASTPVEFVTLSQVGWENVSETKADPTFYPGVTVLSRFSKVRINPATLLVDLYDYTYSTTVGQIGGITQNGYSSAGACNWAPEYQGRANVTLTGTNLQINETFHPIGWGPYGSTTPASGPFGQTVDLLGTGNCGGVVPYSYNPSDPTNFYSRALQLGFVCGNGVMDLGEACDDGNFLNDDGCSSLCQIDAGNIFESEDNDDSTVADALGIGALSATASVVVANATAELGGVDWFEFTADKPFNLDVQSFDRSPFLDSCDPQLSPPPGSDATWPPFQYGTDTIVHLYDSFGELISSDDDGIDYCSHLDPANPDMGAFLTNLPAGTYWLLVEEYPFDEEALEFDYRLRVSVTCYDSDGDTICEPVDACPNDPNNDQDGDGVCGDVDNCAVDFNPGQDDNEDDGLGDVCDPDDDNDSVVDGADNCPVDANPFQENNEGDAQGDVCDADDDNDGVADGADNCQFVSNGAQTNTDGDAEGDACDSDDDNDGLSDGSDNCPVIANPGQENNDGDSAGDVCDSDDDNDGVADGTDNCQFVSNSDQTNTDGDGFGDACDSDDDNDGLNDGGDNCPLNANPGQANNDGDAQGDPCDPDDDNDGVMDGADNCQFVSNASQTNTDGDAYGDACECGDGLTEYYEQCDDGDRDSGDGCSSTCTIECVAGAFGAAEAVVGDAGNPDHCYLLMPAASATDDWNVAQADCVAKGNAIGARGHLVTFTGFNEWSNATAGLSNAVTWIGLRNTLPDNYQWVVSTDVYSFAAWAAGEGPGNSGAIPDCIAANASDAWFDQACTGGAALQYICEIEPHDCGDGVQTGDEQCDDGNSDNTDGCTSQCVNGQVCDSGNYPEGAAFSVDPNTGRCYARVDTAANWNDAESGCTFRGGHLTVPTLAAENDLVQSLAGGARAWIGLNDVATEGTWVSTTGEAVTFTDWYPGQPDNFGGAEHCAEILLTAFDPQARWSDRPCSETIAYICEYPVFD